MFKLQWVVKVLWDSFIMDLWCYLIVDSFRD